MRPSRSVRLLPKIKILLFSGQAATADLLEKARAKATSSRFSQSLCIPQDLLSRLRGLIALRSHGSGQLSELVAAFEGARHGDFVGIFDVTARRDPGGNACDRERTNLRRALGQPAGRGLALERGTGRNDDLIHFAPSRRAAPAIAAQLIGPNAMQRRERAMQHVVDAVIPARPLNASMLVGSSTTQTSLWLRVGLAQ